MTTHHPGDLHPHTAHPSAPSPPPGSLSLPLRSRTHNSSCVMTTWASSAAKCSGERSCGSSTLVSSGPWRAWARSSRTAATSWASTAAHSWRPSDSSVVPRGARNSSCSYLARIHDSRSSLQCEGPRGSYKGPLIRTSQESYILTVTLTAKSPVWVWHGPECRSPTRGWPCRCQWPSAPGSVPAASHPSPVNALGTGVCPGSGGCQNTRCR